MLACDLPKTSLSNNSERVVLVRALPSLHPRRDSHHLYRPHRAPRLRHRALPALPRATTLAWREREARRSLCTGIPLLNFLKGSKR